MTLLSIAQATAQLTAPGAPFELDEVVIRGVKTRVWKHAPRSMRALAEGMHGWGDRTYLVYEDERLSYTESYSRVCTLAHALVHQLGVKKGDRVAIAMRNFPEWPLSFFAAGAIGAVLVPLNAWWQSEELAYGLSDSGATVLITDEKRLELIEPHLKSLPIRHVVVAKSRKPVAAPHLTFESLINGERQRALPEVNVEPDDDATIFYTSGTTGKPKGALGTHRNMMTNITALAFARARAFARRGEAPAVGGTSLKQTSVLLSVPFFHVTGSHSVLAAGTAFGNKLVMMYKWNPERALELIEREKINHFGGVPSMVWQVIESPDFKKRDTSSILGVSYGGAPAAPELVKRIKEVFPVSHPSNGYGLTETSAISAMNSADDYVRKPGSVGAPVPICDVKLVDSEGKEIGSGIGELCIKGPNVVKGYWNKPEETAKAFRDGYLHTGDLARIDEEGFIYILDRAKDMLIRGGENVYCVEVEDALYSHADVIDAAVIGIPHRVLGEEVGAVVQLRPDSKADVEILRAHVAERLAGFKVPVQIILRSEPLPRNANGKILKRQLKEELGWKA